MVSTPVVKVWDMAYPRLRVPDLDAMEAFLADFGLKRAERRDDALFLRGAGTNPVVHAIEKGEPGLIGFAYHAPSLEDLERLARTEGFSPVEESDLPGGGWRTSTVDPDGFQIEVVTGFERVEASTNLEPRKTNQGERFERVGALQRIPAGPSRIKRFGHLALNVADVPRSLAWHQRLFGIIASDKVNLAPGMPIAVFTRCDRGDQPADHHSVLFVSNMSSGGVSGLNHMAWEVCDFDDVQAGGSYLASKGRTHEWGVGRHLLGSQVFDYWRDPWGHIHEHWTDGDQLDASVPTGDFGVDVAAISQWGPDMPPTFGRTIATGSR